MAHNRSTFLLSDRFRANTVLPATNRWKRTKKNTSTNDKFDNFPMSNPFFLLFRFVLWTRARRIFYWSDLDAIVYGEECDCDSIMNSSCRACLRDNWIIDSRMCDVWVWTWLRLWLTRQCVGFQPIRSLSISSPSLFQFFLFSHPTDVRDFESHTLWVWLGRGTDCAANDVDLTIH